jgi:predicted glycosyltransferase
MNTQKTILICPLNWGLGHATRDIPIIRRLQAMGYKVVVATESPLTELINEAIPGLTFEDFPGPKVTYSKSKWLIFKLLGQMPLWLRWQKKEQAIIHHLVQKHQPQIILSDNRYGARHPKVHSILLTHQLMVKLPTGLKWADALAHRFILRLIQPFDACWIPDFEKADSLAGDLVHRYPLPGKARLIGPLSRFMDTALPRPSSHPAYNCLAILSGPEPQKSLLKNLLIEKLTLSPFKSLIITGEPNLALEKNFPNEKAVTLIPHLNQEKLTRLIRDTPLIIARSGYTTIMDLYFLNKNALLVPTPGQTEQNYLAVFNSKKHPFISQNDLTTTQLGGLPSCFPNKDSDQQPENSLLQAALNTIAFC